MRGERLSDALAEADSAHLGERADGLAAAATGVLDAGDERRGDGAEADEQDAETALGRLDRVGREFDEVFGFQDHTSLAGERHEWHLPLRGHSPCLCPVFDCALPLSEQGSKCALAAKTPDDPLGGVRSFFHGSHPNEFFVSMQVAAEEFRTTYSAIHALGGMGGRYCGAERPRGGTLCRLTSGER